MSGGSGDTRYFASFGFLDDNGYSINTGYKRYTTRLNVNTKVKDWLSLNSNINYAYSESVQNGQINGSENITEFADKRKKPSNDHRYEFEELGLPMSENLTSASIDSVVDVLGEANRPELLLGFRDGKAPESINESKIYDSKIYGAKTLLASIRPNIVTDLDKLSQIPANWIPLSIKPPPKLEDDFYTLEIPYDQTADEGPRSSLSIYNNMGLLTFALYAVDQMGQIVRAPGKNIRITPLSPNLSYCDPNGFAGGVPVHLNTKLSPASLLSIEENVITGLTLNGEGFVGMSKELKINFYKENYRNL